MKYIVESFDTEPDDPPCLAVGVLNLDEDEDIEYEYQLIQLIFEIWGEGKYGVSFSKGKNQLIYLWKGRIEDEENRISYITLNNNLFELLGVKIKTKPMESEWKTCKLPDFEYEDIDVDFAEY